MTFDSPLAFKRRRLITTDSMEFESVKAKLEAVKEKYGREIRVFETSKPSEVPSQVANPEETDDFFEFTAQDYYHLMSTKKEDKYLKTRKIREAEEAARRSRMTKSVIRIRFPDNHTLEVTFHPSEKIQSIFDLLGKVLIKPESPYHLYTTPPKKVIKDTSQDFFAAGFIPGAVVYFSNDLLKEGASSGPFLQDDLMSINGLDLDHVPNPRKELDQSGSDGVRAGSHPPAQERKATDKKVVKPKWLKM